MAHPFGEGPHDVFVPPGFVFPDVSKSPGAAQPDGAVQGSPAVDEVSGRIITIDHTK